MKPEISVIVTNYNGKKFLKPCLTSILQEKTKNFEVLFVDDHSSDNSYKHVSKFFYKNPKVRLFHNSKNLGTSKSFNFAMKQARGKYLFYINNDTLLETGWSKEIIRGFKLHRKAAVLQGKIYTMYTQKHFDYAGDFMGPFGTLIERAQGAQDIGQFNKTCKVFSIKGTCMIVRKKVLEAIGGFDEDYKFGLDETDMTWRCWLAGYETLYFPYLTVWHYYGTKDKKADYYKAAKIHYEGSKNTIAMHIKNLGTKRLFTILPINILIWLTLALVFLLKLDFERASALSKGVFWNLTHIFHLLKNRSLVQKSRVLSDDKIFAIVGATRPPAYYVQKGFAYITGRPF